MQLIYTRQKEGEPSFIFLFGVAAYVAVLCIATILHSDALKAATYAIAIALLLLGIAVAALLPRQSIVPVRFVVVFSLYYAGIATAALVNFGELTAADDPAVLIKLLMAPAFLMVGAAFEENRSDDLWQRQEIRALFWSLAVMPLLVWLWQRAVGGAVFDASARYSMLAESTELSVFANRNNAALYAVTLLALFNVLSGKPVRSVLLILALCSAFGTLGVLLAAIAALTLSVSGIRSASAILGVGLAIALVYTIVPDLPGMSRIGVVIKSAVLVADGSINLHTVTYRELVETLNTSDLSFLFRLKHWLNLLDIYGNASGYELIFGLGIGSSVRLSEMGLVPHNDYIRLLFECGILGFLGFSGIIATIIFSCGRRWETIPLLIVAIYFFSENLVNNYLAMIIFYFCAGSLTTRLAKARDA